MSRGEMKTIEEDIKSNKIIVFMKGTKEEPQCGFSAAIVDILKVLSCPFETRDVLQSDELREGIKNYSNWPTIPQLYVNGNFIGGCDITKQLYESGELSKIIQEADNK